MGLNFTEILHGELPDLNGAGVSILTDTTKESFFVGEDLHLGDVVARITAIRRVRCVPNFTSCSCNESSIRIVWNVHDTQNFRVRFVEVKWL